MFTIPILPVHRQRRRPVLGPPWRRDPSRPKTRAAAARPSITTPPRFTEAIQVEHSGGPSRERLLRENEELRRENGQLWDWLYQTIEFPRAKRRSSASGP